MGIPPKIANLQFSALPFRAYNRIWNEHFRDENLQKSVYFEDTDTNLTLDDTNKDNYKLLPRNKGKDYFTSALPWPQKGTVPVIDGTSDLNGHLILNNP